MSFTADNDYTQPVPVGQRKKGFHFIDEPGAGRWYKQRFKIKNSYFDNVPVVLGTPGGLGPLFSYKLVMRSDANPAGNGLLEFEDTYAQVPVREDEYTTYSQSSFFANDSRIGKLVLPRGVQPVVPLGATTYGPFTLQAAGFYGNTVKPSFLNLYSESWDVPSAIPGVPSETISNYDTQAKDVYIWRITEGQEISLAQARIIPAVICRDYVLQSVGIPDPLNKNDSYKGKIVVEPSTVRRFMGPIWERTTIIASVEDMNRDIGNSI